MLRQGQAWLADQLGAHASREIVYRRGGLSAMLVATIGKSEYEQDSQDGHIIRRQVRDFLIRTTALTSSAISSLPQPGDRIIEQQGSEMLVFEVAGYGGDPAWRYSDPFRQLLRIHTKQVNS